MKKSVKFGFLALLALLAFSAILLATDTLYEKTFANEADLTGGDPVTAQATSKPVSHPSLNKKSTKIAASKAPLKTLKSAYAKQGFDWSLPANTRAESYSGLIDEADHGLKFVNSVFVIVRWDETNPRQGHYNFAKFEKYLASVTPNKVLVRLEVNSICEAPKWAAKQLRHSKDKSLVYWDKNYIRLMTPYIQAFAQRYAADSRVAGVQLGIADGRYNNGSCDFSNKDGWGEFWMPPQLISEAQKKFGFSPKVFERQTKKIINLYAEAFGQYRYKLAFTNLGPLFSWGETGQPYNQKLKAIAQYVLDKGVGNRDGHIEIWMRFLDNMYGEKITSLSDGSCRLDFDEDYARRIKGRYWGTENEFYGNKDYVIEEHGPYANQPYRFMVSSLRALQMRRNFISVSGDASQTMKSAVYQTQDFLGYLNKTMGKHIENTPDAFVLLGERYVTQDHAASFANEPCVKNHQKVAIRSFGRWLTEASNSQAALKIKMPASENNWGQNYYLPDGVDYEYSARKSKQFEFDLNDRLAALRCKNSCRVEVKLTFKDTHKTGLQIQTAAGSTQAFITRGDKAIKTVTFTLESPFRNGLQGHDFILRSDRSELPLILARINFL